MVQRTMMHDRKVLAEARGGRTANRERLRRYVPLDSGPQEIRSLDGLRAIAALLVVLYHAFAFSVSTIRVSLGPINLYPAWNYGRTGVQLFFVLSGFLLFLPYARAILLGQQLPAARKFYQRRILRIVPAYWVCLSILVLINLPTYLNAVGLADVLTHVVFLHNLIPSFDSSIQGPFWTMAVETQYYLLLPAIAWLIARFVADTRSLQRLLIGACGFIAVAVGMREMAALASVRLPQLHGVPLQLATGGLLAVYGTEGRYLEIFGVGMLCAIFYMARTEGRLRFSPRMAQIGTVVLLIAAVAASCELAQLIAVRRTAITSACYACLYPRDAEIIFGPLMLGVAYGLLLLAILFSTGTLRRLFALAPLRFVGLISYSLYLWHLPLIIGVQAYTPAWAPGLKLIVNLGVVIVAIGVAYVSYQLVERPFLRRRHEKASDQPMFIMPVISPGT
ncbi:MAG TPA: acyltransferase [Ktedonobacterales bacterium]|nr:acyltransferase [Ktedonobacterales bacterium]